jgi:hypothetical protein
MQVAANWSCGADTIARFAGRLFAGNLLLRAVSLRHPPADFECLRAASELQSLNAGSLSSCRQLADPIDFF